MNLIEKFIVEIRSDDADTYKQSARLKRLYREVSQEGQDSIDAAFICLCGWSLATLIALADSEGK